MKTLPWNGGLLKRPAATCLVGVPALSVGLPLGRRSALITADTRARRSPALSLSPRTLAAPSAGAPPRSSSLRARPASAARTLTVAHSLAAVITLLRGPHTVTPLSAQGRRATSLRSSVETAA